MEYYWFVFKLLQQGLENNQQSISGGFHEIQGRSLSFNARDLDNITLPTVRNLHLSCCNKKTYKTRVCWLAWHANWVMFTVRLGVLKLVPHPIARDKIISTSRLRIGLSVLSTYGLQTILRKDDVSMPTFVCQTRVWRKAGQSGRSVYLFMVKDKNRLRTLKTGAIIEPHHDEPYLILKWKKRISSWI